MKKLVLLLTILSVVAGDVTAIPNPAAIYCGVLGYEYEDGDCIFPDGSGCDAWQYYCNCEPNGIGCWPVTLIVTGLVRNSPVEKQENMY